MAVSVNRARSRSMHQTVYMETDDGVGLLIGACTAPSVRNRALPPIC